MATPDLQSVSTAKHTQNCGAVHGDSLPFRCAIKATPPLVTEKRSANRRLNGRFNGQPPGRRMHCWPALVCGLFWAH